MRTPLLRRLLAGAVIVALVPVMSAAGGRTAHRRPNVVVIMTDDMRADDLAVMPNVRSLIGDEGMTFSNSFASYPLCCPSRATLLTGQYSHNHGVEFNSPPAGGYQAFDNATALPVALQQAGYHTMHIGKFLNGYGAEDPLEVPPGWSDWRGSVDPSTYRYTDYTLNENGVLTTYADYQTDHYATLASELIRERADVPEPFFLNLAFLAPHSSKQGAPNVGGLVQPVPAPEYEGLFGEVPLPRPPSFNEADVSDKPSFMGQRPEFTQDRIDGIEANYRARQETLLSVDDAVAELVSTLKATGQLDETMIVFTSDNGFFLGEHRVAAGKFLVYEESTRVPLLIRGPGVVQGGVQETLVANIDLAPTIMALAGAEPLVTPDGKPLQRLLANPSATWDRDLLLQTGQNTRGAPVYQAIRTPRFVYAEYENGERELYDLVRDPFQLDSLHDRPGYVRLRARLAERLALLRTCSGAGCR